MLSPRKRAPRRPARSWALWAGLAVAALVPSAGCQVEYAGMTLPSGKYMLDDVQYLPPGPQFPWANTQAATQRSRMSLLGQQYGLGAMPPVPIGPAGTPPPAPGALPPVQNIPGRPTDVNISPESVIMPPPGPNPPPPAPGTVVPAPGGGTVPAPVPGPSGEETTPPAPGPQ
jgi:hypothetical protein